MNRALLVVTVLSAVGCSKKIDNTKAEASIKSGLEAKGVKPDSVTCPSGKSAKKGDNFSCTGTAGGRPFTVDVEQTDDDGAVKWTLKGFIVDAKKIETLLAPSMPAGGTLSCGNRPVSVETGGFKLDCEMKNPDAKMQIVFADDGSMKAVPVGGEPPPKAEGPRPDEPKADEPKAEEPKADEPAAGEPDHDDPAHK